MSGCAHNYRTKDGTCGITGEVTEIGGVTLCYLHYEKHVRDILDETRHATFDGGWRTGVLWEGPWVVWHGQEGHRLSLQASLAVDPLRTPHEFREPPKQRTYLARRGAYVKIGKSANVEKRMKDLAKGGCIMPHDLTTGPLDLLLVLESDAERVMHSRWSEFRVVGEWFRYEGALAEWIVSTASLQAQRRAA